MHHDKLISMQFKPVHFIVRALHKRKSARYQEYYVIQTQQCVACGACAATCPKQAILCAGIDKRNNNR